MEQYILPYKAEEISTRLGMLSSYVTPEFFGYGAPGNSISENTEALQKAIDSGKPVVGSGKYIINKPLEIKQRSNIYLDTLIYSPPGPLPRKPDKPKEDATPEAFAEYEVKLQTYKNEVPAFRTYAVNIVQTTTAIHYLVWEFAEVWEWTDVSGNKKTKTHRKQEFYTDNEKGTKTGTAYKLLMADCVVDNVTTKCLADNNGNFLKDATKKVIPVDNINYNYDPIDSKFKFDLSSKTETKEIDGNATEVTVSYTLKITQVEATTPKLQDTTLEIRTLISATGGILVENKSREIMEYITLRVGSIYACYNGIAYVATGTVDPVVYPDTTTNIHVNYPSALAGLHYCNVYVDGVVWSGSPTELKKDMAHYIHQVLPAKFDFMQVTDCYYGHAAYLKVNTGEEWLYEVLNAKNENDKESIKQNYKMNRAYVGEIKFFGGQLHSHFRLSYGLYCDGYNKSDSENKPDFYECQVTAVRLIGTALEQCPNGIYLKESEACSFVASRTEQIDKDSWAIADSKTGEYFEDQPKGTFGVKFVGHCQNISFTGFNLKRSAIDLSEIKKNYGVPPLITFSLIITDGFTPIGSGFVGADYRLKIKPLYSVTEIEDKANVGTADAPYSMLASSQIVPKALKIASGAHIEIDSSYDFFGDRRLIINKIDANTEVTCIYYKLPVSDKLIKIAEIKEPGVYELNNYYATLDSTPYSRWYVTCVGNYSDDYSADTRVITAYENPELTQDITRTVLGDGDCGANDNNVTWTMYDNGELVISGSGATDNYSNQTSNRPGWYSKFRDKITKVIIEEGVTSVGSYIFSYHGNLVEVSLPSTLTEIGVSTFAQCTSLTEIEIPTSVTGVGSYAFYKTGLEKITFRSADTKINDSANTISESATICGYVDSTAKAYADKYGRTFEALPAA